MTERRQRPHLDASPEPDGRSLQGRPQQGRPQQGRPQQARPAQGRPQQPRPSRGQQNATQPAAVRSASERPATARPAQSVRPSSAQPHPAPQQVRGQRPPYPQAARVQRPPSQGAPRPASGAASAQRVVRPGSYAAAPVGRGPAGGGPARPMRPGVSAGAAGRAPREFTPPKKPMPVWMKVLWVVIVLVLVVSLGALGLIGFKYWQGQNSYEEVATEAFDTPPDVEGTALADITVDWQSLRAVNPDVVGWVYVPGTVINYPIVQADDNETYLTRDFQGNVGGNWLPTYGTIFLTAENAADFSDDNSVIQGHHLQNGSMFAAIADDLKNQDDFNAHRDVYIFTPNGNYYLRSFSIIHSSAGEPIVEANFATPEDMAAYVSDKLSRNLVTPDPAALAAEEMTQIFTLSTCDEYSSGGHYVLFCYVVEYASFDGSAGSGESTLVDPNTESIVDDVVNEQ